MLQRIFAVLSVLLLTAVFATPAWTQDATSEAVCVEQFDADTNYFPDQVCTLWSAPVTRYIIIQYTSS